MDSFLIQYWPNFLGTVTGGIALSVLFFVLKEWMFAAPRVTGLWECEHIVERTAYRPYEGMKVWYRVSLVQDGERVLGFGEKDREDSTAGRHRYEGAGRSVVEITGRLEKNLTRSDRFHLIWSEQGERRKSSTVLDLRCSGSKWSGNLSGSFTSTAAESAGHAFWKRLS